MAETLEQPGKNEKPPTAEFKQKLKSALLNGLVKSDIKFYIGVDEIFVYDERGEMYCLSTIWQVQ